jgi:hypothetical protein
MHKERAENYLFVFHRYFINFPDLTSTIELVKVVMATWRYINILSHTTHVKQNIEPNEIIYEGCAML